MTHGYYAQDTAEIAVLVNSLNHRDRWGDGRTDLEHAVKSIAEEFAELSASIRGIHSDSPALELIELGGMCINALRFFTEQEISDALAIETRRHFPERFADERIQWGK